MTRTGSFFFYWLPLFLYVALIFGLSSESSVPGAKNFNDKFLHTTEYAILAFLLWRAFSHREPDSFPVGRVLMIVVTGAAVGALDEVYQRSTPSRISSIYDWFADVAGIVGMTTLLYLVYKYRRKKGGAYESN